MMEQYVQWRPSAHPPRKRMRQFPRHQKLDLRPDWLLAHCPLTSAVSGSTTHVG
jgi:hypothetical protein